MPGLRLPAQPVFQTTSREALLLLVVFLGLLWAELVNQLRIEWLLNPQYGYGWSVPFLCAFLIWKKTQRGGRPQNAEAPSKASFRAVKSARWSEG